MAEAFGIATGVVSVVGFAGQVVQGVSFLCDIIKDVKNSSESMQELHSNLSLLRTTLERLEASDLPVPPGRENHVRQAYQQCAKKVGALEAILKTHMAKPTDGKAKRKWKRVISGLKAKDIEKQAAGIERAKTFLELALQISHMDETREFQLVQQESSMKLSEGLHMLSSDVRSLGATWRSPDVTTFIQSEVQRYLNLERATSATSTTPPTTPPIQSEGDADSEDDCADNFEDASEYLEIEMDLNKCAIAPDHLDDRRVSRSVHEVWVGFGMVQCKKTITTEYDPILRLPMKVVQHSNYTFLPHSWLASRGIQGIFESASVFCASPIRNAAIRPVCRISNDAAVIKAVRNGHLARVIGLLSRGEASASDIDESGKSLLEHAISPYKEPRINLVITETTVVLVQYLIKCGAEPARALSAIYNQQYVLRQRALWPSGGLSGFSEKDKFANAATSSEQSKEFEKSWKRLEDLGRLCLDRANEDPFEDSTLRLSMWNSSEAGQAPIPLHPFYIYHDKWPVGIEDLATERPDEVFKNLLAVDVPPLSDHHDLIIRLNRRYNILSNFYRDGVMKQVFQHGKRGQEPFSRQMMICGFCNEAPNHLLHSLFARSNLMRCDPRFRGIIRQHVRRMLVLFLENGEDPHLRCACAGLWNGGQGDIRTPTDLAIGRNLLDTWTSALSEVGFDPQDLINDRVVTDPVEACLGVWSQTDSVQFGRPVKLSAETQRKTLQKLAFFH